MQLSEYIFRKSGRRPSRSNPLVKNMAIRCGVSVDMIQSVALGRRYASLSLAEKIEKATQHIVSSSLLVKPKESTSD